MRKCLRYINFCQLYTPLNMEENKVHFRYLMLFFYRKDNNDTQAANKICAVYGEGAVAERTVLKWFTRYKAGDFNLKRREHPGGPSTDEGKIKKLIENTPRHTTRKLTEMLNMSKSTTHEHFVKLGYINRFDVWVPHDLTEKNYYGSHSLYKRNEETSFLKQVVTEDEKWIIHNNVKGKRSWGRRNDPPMATPKNKNIVAALKSTKNDKAPKNEKDRKSFRPICLLSVIGKLFEKLIMSQLDVVCPGMDLLRAVHIHDQKGGGGCNRDAARSMFPSIDTLIGSSSISRGLSTVSCGPLF
ncbi:Histone-lysine N-methyltransferase SETMAR [Melipona quadrifasciata]|uniref:Histone-lysine N-methyltransferase SETMAR n=1 Tax=Melipona quadrifasciata TaxID=166423 RepID=A0A0N0BCR6_9HYME|nr:Histone-lysine N-methyltransferase SETMAR [Melipona quadrifasciata]